MNNKGQSLIEYSFIIGLVVIALSAMQVYIKRGIQAGIKVAADEVGRQQDAEETDPLKGAQTTNSTINTETSNTQRIRLFKSGSQIIDTNKTSANTGTIEYYTLEK